MSISRQVSEIEDWIKTYSQIVDWIGNFMAAFGINRSSFDMRVER